MTRRPLFDRIDDALQGVNHKGHDYHATCPQCGKPPAGRTDSPNFTYSERGFICFPCGFSGGLVALAQYIGVWEEDESETPYVPQAPRPTPQPKPKKEATSFPAWMAHGVKLDTLYPDLDTEDALRKWQVWGYERFWSQYKPALELDSVLLHGLTVGYPPYALPKLASLSRDAWRRHIAEHPPHLILPVMRDDELVMVRHRPYPYDQNKWMTQGTPARLIGMEMTSFGEDVVICENAIDGLILRQTAWQSGLEMELNTLSSSGGAMTWQAGWALAILQRIAPRHVFLWMDNDDAGDRGTAKIKQDFLDVGVRVLNLEWESLGFGLKADLGDVIGAYEEREKSDTV